MFIEINSREKGQLKGGGATGKPVLHFLLPCPYLFCVCVCTPFFYFTPSHERYLELSLHSLSWLWFPVWYILVAYVGINWRTIDQVSVSIGADMAWAWANERDRVKLVEQSTFVFRDKMFMKCGTRCKFKNKTNGILCVWPDWLGSRSNFACVVRYFKFWTYLKSNWFFLFLKYKPMKYRISLIKLLVSTWRIINSRCKSFRATISQKWIPTPFFCVKLSIQKKKKLKHFIFAKKQLFRLFQINEYKRFRSWKLLSLFIDF